jgi:multidrug resistance efflux pump
MSQRRQNIPIPPAQHLQTLRMKVAPIMVFGVAVIVVASLWKETVTPAILVAEVASVQSSINSPVTAAIQTLSAQRLQMVKKGDVLAELRPADPRQALDLMQGELSLLRASHSQQDADAAKRKEIMDFEKLKLDWMSEKVALASASAVATKAGMELEEAQQLTNPPAGAKRFLRDAQLAKEAAEAEVTERRVLVDTLGKRVQELSVTVNTTTAHDEEAWSRAIANQEERLRTLERNLSIVTLRAPIDGMVTAVLRRAGENVKEGEPLVVITATKAERIIGYMRQPFALEPKVGLEVEVRTHGRARLRGMSQITSVGSHFEPIINPALHPATTPEVGLPIEASLPANLSLRPGELVSLIIRSNSGNASDL